MSISNVVVHSYGHHKLSLIKRAPYATLDVNAMSTWF